MPKATDTSSSSRSKKRTEMDEEIVLDMIRKRAYELHEQRGGEHGRDLEDWIEAERLVKAEMRRKR